MNVRYWAPPGTAAEISRTGGPFVALKTDTLWTFAGPFAEFKHEFVFEGDGWLIRVAKALVYRCEWDGNGGSNRLCE